MLSQQRLETEMSSMSLPSLTKQSCIPGGCSTCVSASTPLGDPPTLNRRTRVTHRTLQTQRGQSQRKPWRAFLGLLMPGKPAAPPCKETQAALQRPTWEARRPLSTSSLAQASPLGSRSLIPAGLQVTAAHHIFTETSLRTLRQNHPERPFVNS